MEWIPKYEQPKLVLVNVTGLAAYDEEKCKFCGRYGCTDRGYTLTAGDPPVTIGEAPWARLVEEKLAELIENNKETVSSQYVSLDESQCIRVFKKSNLMTVIERLNNCNADCCRNKNIVADGIEGGIWRERDEGYSCPFRDVNHICQRNLALDHGPLVCTPDKDGLVECKYHEEAYNGCFKKAEGQPCYDLKEKLGVTDEENDYLLMLVHRFNATPCRHCDEGECKNPESQHFEGACSLKGLMAPCERYEAMPSDKAYTEGVCTYVSSMDGKDDRKIFNSSDYAFRLSTDERITLCLACRISHSIARATGLKCLGVRRSASNPFLNDKNPLHQHAVQVNYLYLTHLEDVAKYNPDLIARAVYDALMLDCNGLGCEEKDECNFIK
jgi:hypothetical protein